VTTATSTPAIAIGPVIAIGTAMSEATEALRSVLAQPVEAQARAQAAVELARGEADLVAASIAERALGHVAMQLEHFDAAAQHFRTARRLARTAGDEERVAEARSSLSYVLARQGKTRAALREIEAANGHLHGVAAAWLETYRALVLKGLGRWDEALAAYQRALPVFRRAGEQLGEARALANRGVVQAYRGAYGAAERDLARADALLLLLGQDFSSAVVRQTLGYVAGRRGDIPLALARYDEAEATYRRHRSPPATLWMDRGELLLWAGLAAEARETATQAVAEFRRYRQAADVAEARLLLAQAMLLDGEPDEAWTTASQAARAFARQRRPAWAALARRTMLQACLAGAGDGTGYARAAVRTAAELDRAGWRTWAVEARLVAGQLALTEGRERLARRELLLASRARQRGPAWQRAQGWQAEALLRLSAGDRGGARRAADRGLAVLEHYRATLGATDLRAGASTRSITLAEIGLRLALEDGTAAAALCWVERARAIGLLYRPVRPPADAGLGRDLAELRRAAIDERDAVRSGRAAGGPRRRQVELERQVRDRSRISGGAGGVGRSVVDVGQLRRRLGDTAMVVYFALDGRLRAVTVAPTLGLYDLGPTVPVLHELDLLPFFLRRLAWQHGTPASLRAADAGVRHAANRLDDVLFGQLRTTLGDRPLVVVPNGALSAMPWSVLPSCRGRPLVVAPSATTWTRAAAAPQAPADSPTVLVAGPDLPHARVEVDALRRHYPTARTLTGPAATADAVVAALEGAGLAHVAAHGHFRADNPQFSSLRLHDGPLTVYDLECLHAAPHQVILSACNSGRTPDLASDEVLGLVAVFLALGTTTLIASVAPVPDEETASLMADLHARLVRGAPPAVALAGAQEAAGADGAALAASSGFVCFGAS